ncbi:MAG TPA: hypothetical protein VM406_00310 [Noviherbaspirillum sp.]|nr:hypothetical protein [Noviherbaspirillum sp.]
MPLSSSQRSLLPLVGLQGAVHSLGGFIGFFVVGEHSIHALLRYTAGMMTAAMLATFIAYAFGSRLGLSARGLLRLGFVLPGVLLLAAGTSVAALALAFGTFLGMTWSARHALEMSLMQNRERDGYAAHAVAMMLVPALLATLAATVILALGGQSAQHVYWFYGAMCVAGGLLLGRGIPDTEPVALKAPLAVLRQPQFIACLPLFFLESGLFGISQAMAAAGAVQALGSASQFGWVATVAGLVGGCALYLTRRQRDIHNRAGWLGAACLVIGLSYVLLGASAWLPALFVVHAVTRAAGMPFLSASQQVMNQCTLDVRGELSDRIFARELVLWLLRMISLGLFWLLAMALTPIQLLVAGASVLACATALEYLLGKSLFGRNLAHQPA